MSAVWQEGSVSREGESVRGAALRLKKSQVSAPTISFSSAETRLFE